MRKLAFDVLPMSEWPADDMAAWNKAIAGGGYFDEQGPLAHHTPTYLHNIGRAYGRWLGFLKEKIEDAALASGLAMADDAKLLEKFVEALALVAPCTARGYLTNLFTACRGLKPEAPFCFLHRAMLRSWRTARPITNKTERMVPARDLAALGHSIMTEAASLSTPLKRASYYRDGLMITMLIYAPARITSFVGIRLGKELIWDGTRYRMCFEPHQVKNKRYLEYPLPVELNDAIETWLNIYRPICLARRGRWHRDHAGDAFWISESGAPFIQAARVRERIERITEERLGRHINPHLFRDIAATSIASEIPEHVGIVRPVLGHASLDSGMRFYNQGRSNGAAGEYQALLATFRTPPSEGMTI
jgi:integrase